MPNASGLLTTVETAERLGRNRWYVIRLVRDGKLTPAAQAPGKNGAFLFDPVIVDRLTGSGNGGGS